MAEQSERERSTGVDGLVAGEISIRNASVGDVKADTVNIVQSRVGDVEGQQVRMTTTAAQSVRATEVAATLSASLQVEAQNATLKGCSVGMVEADQVEFGPGAVYAAMGENINLKSCGVRVALARDHIEAEHGMIGVAAAREIHADEIRTGFLIAREVQGSVRALFDVRAAAVFGAAFGAAYAAVRLFRKR
jgi:hypothetical protein